VKVYVNCARYDPDSLNIYSQNEFPPSNRGASAQNNFVAMTQQPPRCIASIDNELGGLHD